jgi:DNA-binding MarR family transcriptional regulator
VRGAPVLAPQAPTNDNLLSSCYVACVAARQPPDDPWSQFALSVFMLNDLLMRAGEGITRPIGQSSARWQVLGRVHHESQTVAQIARSMGHARQGVQRIADALAQERLILYTTHPTDARTKLLELTPRGADVLAAIYTRQVEWQAGIMAKLNPQQLVELAGTLEGIGRLLETEVDERRESGMPDQAVANRETMTTTTKESV